MTDSVAVETTEMPTVQRGSEGSAVRELQQALNHRYPNLPQLTVDGRFGERTYERVVYFQKDSGLTADGVVGPKTWAALGFHGASTPGQGARPIPASEVTYGGAGTFGSGEAACAGYIDKALDAIGFTAAAARANWRKGMLTIASRESSYNARTEQVNTTDVNAHGPIQSDGHPLYCSRGGWQCIPPTFAQYHESGTSNDIYDPVANCAAAINYILADYHVSADGSDLAAKVQQADPARPPHGY